MDVTSNRRLLFDFVRDCQEFAGRILDANADIVTMRLHDLALSVRPDYSIHDRLAVRHLFGNAVAHAARCARIDRHSDLAAAIIEWNLADITAANWHVSVARLSQACAQLIRQSPVVRFPPGRSSNPRVARILAIIAERFADPSLRVIAIAKTAGISRFYADRLVERETGLTIAEHIQSVRICAARQALQYSSSSIKDISVQVGYATPSQFGRVFRRLTGTTPSAFRFDPASPK